MRADHCMVNGKTNTMAWKVLQLPTIVQAQSILKFLLVEVETPLLQWQHGQPCRSSFFADQIEKSQAIAAKVVQLKDKLSDSFQRAMNLFRAEIRFDWL